MAIDNKERKCIQIFLNFNNHIEILAKMIIRSVILAFLLNINVKVVCCSGNDFVFIKGHPVEFCKNSVVDVRDLVYNVTSNSVTYRK